MSFEASSRELLWWAQTRARQALVTGTVAGSLGLAASFLVPKQYTARASFTVASESNVSSMNRLAGFAAQLGIAGSLSSDESPDYFAQVATLRDVKMAILRDTVCTFGEPCRPLGTILFGITLQDADHLTQERTLKKLSKRMTVTVDPKTGIINIAASAHTPEQAEAILTSQLEALSAFVLQKRESQARNERVFAEKRLAELEQKRKTVVADITAFYEKNHSFSLSPELRFRERELQEQLSLWQELVQSVARQGELARLDEARDIPAITILERPYASRKKTSPRRLLWAFAGLIGGLAIGLRLDRLVKDRGSLLSEPRTLPVSQPLPTTTTSAG